MQRRRAPRGSEGLWVDRREGIGYLAAGGKTDLTLQLRTPRQLMGLLGPTSPVTTLHVAADEPEVLAEALRQRISLANS